MLACESTRDYGATGPVSQPGRRRSKFVPFIAAGVAFMAAVALVAIVLESSEDEPAEMKTYSWEPKQQYEIQYGKEQPEGGLHLARRYDPWARDGFTRRGSFVAERRVVHKLHDSFWLIVTGKPDHRIECTVRGYKEVQGKVYFDHFQHTFKGTTALMSDILPPLHEGESDTLTCTDLLTGEVQYFTFHEFKPDDTPVYSFQTTNADKWLRKHGFGKFSAPLKKTSGAMKDEPALPGTGGLSEGEIWEAMNGHPHTYQPKYEEPQAYTTVDEAKAIGKKRLRAQLAWDKGALKIKREHHARDDAWKKQKVSKEW
eukprot:CAMPEP_0114559614 /NCGR_PEP_ID=MMETSP0114-20121206/11015_1 /TAXON_ID=31324 /ORGANISM="Goniomonas sp, Strain m" /LENGTH=313 /DNA_ID=CAMNT_0001745095 /DNA_START=9 /DNA_END=947 /DNA_ORIENTATION=+